MPYPRLPRTSRSRLAAFGLVAAVLVLVAGGGFAALESDTVANTWEGLWWALSLMTTVGFVGECRCRPAAGSSRRC